jgi:cellulose synthase/poly-beta-1,6-N-acetylglucosamine synthase-like glycosyltransferase
MTELLTALLILPALALALLAGFFALEIIGALLPPRTPRSAPPGPVTVIVPAHDEAATIAPALAAIKSQLRPEDRLLVVADNCSDDTAEIAMRAGASVLVRNDPARRGKGYALQFALDSLGKAPPAVVVFIDADCRIGKGALAHLAGAAAAGRPAQALCLMQAGEGAPAKLRAAEFAWIVMNRVRMRGLYTLFDVCRLTGSGMALPWTIARWVNLASGEIVEDLALSASLTEAGAAPVHCADALVFGVFPNAEEGAVTQRARWEHGSLRLAWRRAPALFVRAAKNRDLRLAAAALDLAIPPLGVFGALAALMVLVTALARAVGASAPFSLSLWGLAAFIAAIAAAWLGFGRRALPLSQFGALFEYFLQKLKVYGRSARDSTKSWTRTPRDDAGDAP